jgi:hypothetical protein
MALTKSAQTPQASATNTAGSTATSSALAIGYGVSIIGKITNGATGPTVACDFVVQVSSDSGTTMIEYSRQTASAANNAVSTFVVNLGIGAGGDWGHYKTVFTGNTAQSVTVQADAESTTAL